MSFIFVYADMGRLFTHFNRSVLNTFKSMVQDEDILEKDDMYILDRMREFLKQDDVYQFAAAKGLLTLIERSVSISAVCSAHRP